jgi:hypothetical protein
LVALTNKIFIVHTSLDDQETSRYKRFFEKLALEHLDKVFDADIGFLFNRVGNLRQIHAAGCVDTLQLRLCLLLKGLLLLQESNLVAFLESELRVLAVNALAVNRAA